MGYQTEREAMRDLLTELCCYMREYRDFDSLEMVNIIAEKFSIEDHNLDEVNELADQSNI